jgi:hypothetical protein
VPRNLLGFEVEYPKKKGASKNKPRGRVSQRFQSDRGQTAKVTDLIEKLSGKMGQQKRGASFVELHFEVQSGALPGHNRIFGLASQNGS